MPWFEVRNNPDQDMKPTRIGKWMLHDLELAVVQSAFTEGINGRQVLSAKFVRLLQTMPHTGLSDEGGYGSGV